MVWQWIFSLLRSFLIISITTILLPDLTMDNSITRFKTGFLLSVLFLFCYVCCRSVYCDQCFLDCPVLIALSVFA